MMNILRLPWLGYPKVRVLSIDAHFLMCIARLKRKRAGKGKEMSGWKSIVNKRG